MEFKQILSWVKKENVHYLLGAGCSACANKPLINELTQNVLKDNEFATELEILECFKNLKGQENRDATIEDLLNYLIRKEFLLNNLNDRSKEPLGDLNLSKKIEKIKKLIIKHIGYNWEASDYHKRFLKRIKTSKNSNIFSLNYDVLIEASLEELKYSYIDGFTGAQQAFFDSNIFNDNENIFKLYKLHGSINWVKSEEVIRRIPIAEVKEETSKNVMVYPCEQKYIQTQYGIYEHLMTQFRNTLRCSSYNNTLITIGYSYNDEHINVAIEDALESNENLHVLALIGGESPTPQFIKKLTNYNKNERFNALVGNDCFIGSLLTNDEFALIKEKELWKFENFIELIEKGKL